MGEMSPERVKYGDAISAGGEEAESGYSKHVGDVECPAEEDVADDAERSAAIFFGDHADELFEMGLQFLGGFHETEEVR